MAVATDPAHPLHLRHAFEALSVLVRVATPERVTHAGKDDSAVALDIGALFVGDTRGPHRTGTEPPGLGERGNDGFENNAANARVSVCSSCRE